jgi:hypothetical protein
MAAPVGRLPQVRESYSRRVGQTKNAAVVQTFRRPHYMCACPSAFAGAGYRVKHGRFDSIELGADLTVAGDFAHAEQCFAV